MCPFIFGSCTVCNRKIIVLPVRRAGFYCLAEKPQAGHCNVLSVSSLAVAIIIMSL